MSIIYSPGQGLGDNWYAVNKLLRECDSVEVSIFSRPEPSKRVNCYEKLKEIFSVLDAPTKRILVTQKKPTNYGSEFFARPWDVEYFPTRKTYHKNNSNIICYQFDGQFQKQVGGLPDPLLLRKLFASLMNRYVFVYIGLPLPLKVAVHYLATCRCFLGTSSGMTHVAHSVGTPTCLIEGSKSFKDYHYGQKYFLTSALEEVENFVEHKYKGYETTR